MRELNEAELKKLAEMTDDKKNAIPALPLTEDIQRKIVGAFLTELEIVQKLRPIFKPEYMSNEAHICILREIYSHFDKYNVLPSFDIIKQMLTESLKERDKSVVLHFTAELATAKTYYIPGLHEHSFILDKCTEFGKMQIWRNAVDATALAYHERDPNKLIAALPKTIEELQGIASFGDTKESLNTWEYVMENQESEDWLIPNWLEFGSLAMINGDPFSGKSHILTKIYAGIIKNGEFGRYKNIPKCAILLFDAENKKRILVKRLGGELDGDFSEVGKYLYRYNPEYKALPIPIADAPAFIQSQIQEIKKKTGLERVFVVVDTLRSIFKADEMETGEMKDLLYPLQRVAQAENAAILILHHRPKSGAAYSGQSAIAGCLDYQWLWESDPLTMVGKLTLYGTRGDREPPMGFKLENGKNRYIDALEQFQTAEDQVRNLVMDVLKDGAKVKQGELWKAVQNRWTGSTVGRDKLITMIDGLLGSILVVEFGINNAKYYSLLSEQPGNPETLDTKGLM